MIFDMYPSRLTSSHRATEPRALEPPTRNVQGKKGFSGKSKGQGQGQGKGMEQNGFTAGGAGVPNGGYNGQAVPMNGNQMV